MASSSSSGGVPPGFRFHPTDEELLHYYLRKKVLFEKFDLEVIREVDLNKMEPWELQERCRIGSAPQNEWYFFSHKDRKYPTGSRTNRATNAGFWKATGRDKCIRNSYKKIGMRKTLVFYRGRAPHGQKTDWIMHEYRLEEGETDVQNSGSEDGWVVCRVFKKKHFFKLGSTSTSAGAGGGGGETSSNSQGVAAENHLMALTATDSSRPHHYLHPSDPQYQRFMDHQQPSSGLYRSDLALHYMPTATHHYQVQNLLPDHRQHQQPPSYDFAAVLPGEPTLRPYEPTGLELGGGGGTGEEMQHVAEGRDPNDWTVLVAASTAPAVAMGGGVNQMGHMSNPRGEMDLWRYGK